MAFANLIARIGSNQQPAYDDEEVFEQCEERTDGGYYCGFYPIHYIIATKATNFYKFIPRYATQLTYRQTVLRLAGKQKFLLEAKSSPLHVAVAFDNSTAVNALLCLQLQRNVYLESALHVSCYFAGKSAALLQEHIIDNSPLELCYADANSYSAIQLFCIYGRHYPLNKLLLAITEWVSRYRNSAELHQIGRQFFGLNEHFLDLYYLCLKPIEYTAFGTTREEKQQTREIVAEIQQLFTKEAERLDLQKYINYCTQNKRCAFSDSRNQPSGDFCKSASFYI